MKQINTTRFKFQQTNLSCIEKVFLAKCKRKFILKNRKNKEEIQGVYERNLQNSSSKLVYAIFLFFPK